MIHFTGIKRSYVQIERTSNFTLGKLDKSVLSEQRDLWSLSFCSSVEWGGKKKEEKPRTDLLRLYLWLVLPLVEMVKKII